MTLVVVGSVALDDIHTSAESRTSVLGGSASFFSVGASVFGPVRLVAVVGEDFPEEYVERFRGRRVDVDGLTRAKGKTFHWAGRYTEDFSLRTSLTTELNVFAEFDPVLPESYRNATHLFLGNIHPRLQLKVLDQMKGRPFVAADTMNYWIENARDELGALFEKIHLLVINDEEARLLAGGTCIHHAAQAVRRMGPEAVVVKRGEHGASLFHPEGMFFLPAYPLEHVKDPTGAGDTFASGLMGYLAARTSPGKVTFEDLKQAMAFGTALASFTCQEFSLEGLWPLTLERLFQRYTELARMTCFSPLPQP